MASDRPSGSPRPRRPPARPGKFAPIDQNRSASERVAERLRGMIASGNIAPGEKLPGENDLARALHVSRTVVREALRGLAMMGIVSIRRGGGCYVTDLKAARLMAPISFALSLREYDLGGLFRAREIIDAGLAADAARNATSVHIGRLRELVAAGYRAAANPKGFGVLDREFHELIGTAAANDFLDSVARSLYGLGAETGSKAYSSAAVLDRSAADHQRIADAIAARDPEAARVAMRDHVIHIRETRLAEAGAKEQLRNAR